MPNRWSFPTHALAADLRAALTRSGLEPPTGALVRAARDVTFGELTVIAAPALARRDRREVGEVASVVAGVVRDFPSVAAVHLHVDGRVDLRLDPAHLDRMLVARRADERDFDRGDLPDPPEVHEVLLPDDAPDLRRRLLDHTHRTLARHPAVPEGTTTRSSPDPAGFRLISEAPRDSVPAALAAVLVLGLQATPAGEVALLDPVRLLTRMGPGPCLGLLEGYLRVDAQVRYGGEPPELPGETDAPPAALAAPSARRLTREVLVFPEVVLTAHVRRAPTGLVRYLERVVSAAEAFYHHPRLINGDPQVTRARVQLLAAARDTIWSSLRQLGVRVPRNLGRGFP